MAKDPRHHSLLRRIRIQHGLTQSQFAEIAGVGPKTVQRWERGTSSPRLFSIQRLCMHFNITPADLGVLDTDQQQEESKENQESIRHHPKDGTSPDRHPCFCLPLALLGSFLGTWALLLQARDDFSSSLTTCLKTDRNEQKEAHMTLYEWLTLLINALALVIRVIAWSSSQCHLADKPPNPSTNTGEAPLP